MSENNTDLFTRIDFGGLADPCIGQVRWSPVKSIWWSSMLIGWVVLGTLYFSWSAVIVFLATTAFILCLGHSIGMHRLLIHESFKCSPVMEKLLVYTGTLVGLGGPMTMMHMHDMRDWAQRQPNCHPFLSHNTGILTDFWWQLHCKLYLTNPPAYTHPKRIAESPFFRFIQHTSMAQQALIALVLYYFGGLGWVAWGVCGRVTVSIFGHWIIGHFAHNSGQRDWHIKGAAVQGHNVRYFGLITFGESWHNNHHAFPGSAKLGIFPGQADPGWVVLKLLRSIGLVNNLQQPDDLPPRPELVRLGARSEKLSLHAKPVASDQ